MNTFLFLLFVVVCILLIIVVLLQKGRGGGIGAAFGGGGGSHSAFGTRTGDVFTWVTIVLTGVFLLLAIGSSLSFRPATTQLEVPQFNPSPDQRPVTAPAIRLERQDRVPGIEIYFTTDGTDPKHYPDPVDPAQLYDTAIVLEKDKATTIKAYAHHKNPIYKDSPIVTGVFYPPGVTTQPEAASGPTATAPAGTGR